MAEALEFSKIAPYLFNPLVLIGFGLFLFFGIHRALIGAKILAPLSPRQSSGIIRLFLNYGFWIAIGLLVLGFGYAFYGASGDRRSPITQQSGNCAANVVGDNNKTSVNCADSGGKKP